MLVSPKDKPPLEQIPGTVYHISCWDYEYIWESARPLGKLRNVIPAGLRPHLLFRSTSSPHNTTSTQKRLRSQPRSPRTTTQRRSLRPSTSRPEQSLPKSGQGFGVGPRMGRGFPLKKEANSNI